MTKNFRTILKFQEYQEFQDNWEPSSIATNSISDTF